MSDLSRDPVLVPAFTARGTRGAVASPHALATGAGIAMLRAGGSAVDAAIATNAALSVVAAYMCGLGGDAFWLIWTEDAGLEALNGSGRSAAGATIDAAHRAGLDGMPQRGPWTVTVPGAIRSWGDAHARHGRLPWSSLLEPAIELAGSFPASPTWCATIERAASVFRTDGDWARVFRPDGRPWRRGEPVALPALAATLRRLAGEGPDAAYDGGLAARAAEYLEGAGSPLRVEDLTAHRSTWAEPIRVAYRGFEAASHPPNSSGAVALELLAVLASLDAPAPASFGPAGVTDAGWIHHVLEAARLTLADRDAWLTDPDHMSPDALGFLLDPGHAAELAHRIDPRRAAPVAPLRAPAGGGTIFLATADRWGGAVSLIQSNYAGFGSGLVDPESGIAYQNRGAFFSLDPAHANALAPGKRTMHTLAPGMLFRDGRPWMVHGSMGGEIQPQVFAEFVSSVVDGRVDVATAIAAPRFAADVVRHYGPPSVTRLEGGMDRAVGEVLAALGHAVEWTAPFSGALGHEHAIELVRASDGRPVSYAAVADPRSEGIAAAW